LFLPGLLPALKRCVDARHDEYGHAFHERIRAGTVDPQLVKPIGLRPWLLPFADVCAL
jgi:hypothetical protein